MEKDEAGTAGISVMGHGSQEESCLPKVVKMVQNQWKREVGWGWDFCSSNCSKIFTEHQLCIRHAVDSTGHSMGKTDLILELRRVVLVGI